MSSLCVKQLKTCLVNHHNVIAKATGGLACFKTTPVNNLKSVALIVVPFPDKRDFLKNRIITRQVKFQGIIKAVETYLLYYKEAPHKE